ncbi:hypothetical protein KAT51_00675 [bacterium]|nr:hypothetical protein [bacterium]
MRRVKVQIQKMEKVNWTKDITAYDFVYNVEGSGVEPHVIRVSIDGMQKEINWEPNKKKYKLKNEQFPSYLYEIAKIEICENLKKAGCKIKSTKEEIEVTGQRYPIDFEKLEPDPAHASFEVLIRNQN